MTPERLAERLAGMLAGLRMAASRHENGPLLVLAEVLLWITAGVDHRHDLQKVTGLEQAQLSRVVNTLGERGLLKGNRYRPGLGLVTTRPHPHRRGEQLLLTADGQRLIDSTFVSTPLQGFDGRIPDRLT